MELLLVNCVVRLEDTSSAVASAAGRCLQHLTGFVCATEGASTEAAQLLQRREQEQMSIEQFIFPFVALVHREDDPSLVARRLQVCCAYLTAGPGDAEASGGDSLGSNVNARGLQICIAAGFVAAAFVRCLAPVEASARPSALLCNVCRDLMDLMAVEDSEFRAQIARILGFFDILSRPRFELASSTLTRPP